MRKALCLWCFGEILGSAGLASSWWRGRDERSLVPGRAVKRHLISVALHALCGCRLVGRRRHRPTVDASGWTSTPSPTMNSNGSRTRQATSLPPAAHRRGLGQPNHSERRAQNSRASDCWCSPRPRSNNANMAFGPPQPHGVRRSPLGRLHSRRRRSGDTWAGPAFGPPRPRWARRILLGRPRSRRRQRGSVGRGPASQPQLCPRAQRVSCSMTSDASRFSRPEEPQHGLGATSFQPREPRRLARMECSPVMPNTRCVAHRL